MSGTRRLIEYGFRNPVASLGLEVVPVRALRQRLSPSARAALHRADFHQLFFVTAGEVETVVDFVSISGGLGTVVHARPGQVLRLPTATTPLGAATAMLFTPSYPSPHPLLGQLLCPFGVAAHHVDVDGLGGLVRQVEELTKQYAKAVTSSEPSVWDRAVLQQLLNVVLLRVAALNDPTPVGEGATATDAVHRFRSEVERSYATTRSVTAYAARLGYSVRTLDRACRDVVGRSAKEVIDDRVVLEAKRLLAHTDVPSSSIARRLGFSEATNFTKFFVRGTKQTPSAFRDANQVGPRTQR